MDELTLGEEAYYSFVQRGWYGYTITIWARIVEFKKKRVVIDLIKLNGDTTRKIVSPDSLTSAKRKFERGFSDFMAWG